MGQEASTTRTSPASTGAGSAPGPAKKRTETVKPGFRNIFLSSPTEDIEPWYDVIVIGSGYGGAIAASRAARAGQKVCVLEKGKEWRPGDFPETEVEAVRETQMTSHNNPNMLGTPTSLYDIIIGPDVSVLQGCGLGGTSLINANVALDCDPRIFQDEVWPQELRENLENLTGIDRQHVYDMMKPHSYPKDYPLLPKLQALGKAATHMVQDIEDLNVSNVFSRAPLFVNFKQQAKNHLGIPQPPCVGCGNCCSGCNTGAKNSLNMNYLPDARAHGAKIFTEVEVRAITRDDSAPDAWRVHFISHEDDSIEEIQERYVRANIVILGAGPLGSTNILMKSVQHGLDVSTNLGKRFSTNGDNIGFSYDGDSLIKPVGRLLAEVEAQDNGPGPCVTGVIDMRSGKSLEEGFVLQDGTPPSCVDIPYKLLLKTIGSHMLSTVSENSELNGETVDRRTSNAETTDGARPSKDRKVSEDGRTCADKKLSADHRKLSQDKERRELARVFSVDGFDNTLSFIALSNDEADGEVRLDQTNGRVWIHYPDVGEGRNNEAIKEGMKLASDGLNGEFIPNPPWGGVVARLQNTKGAISVHPLGGCPMGECGETGVVNHRGQVFKGHTKEVHKGLFVVDGAVMPRSLGVNPALTIAMVAERCMRLLANEYGWRIDYQKFIHLRRDRKVDIVKPGIRFNEKMSGELYFNNQPHHCHLALTIESRDVQKMIKLDMEHSAQIRGTVICNALSEHPMTILYGRFQLLAKSNDKIETRETVYKMVLTSEEGKQYYLYGKKEVHKDSAFEMGMTDTTEMNLIVYEGTDVSNSGRAVAAGKLLMTWKDFMKEMLNSEVINTQSAMEKLRWKARFSRFYMGILWETYGMLTSASSPFDPDAPPREKRPLNVKGIEPEVFCFKTDDGIRLALTRYKGGTKGPVMLAHGMGVSTEIYTLDTIDKNFLEFLVEHDYDVWVVEWRASVMMAAHELQHNLDSVAKYDMPMAINRILAETGAKDVQVVVHCVGSITFFMSMVSGQLEGKIRSIVASQVAFCTIPSAVNWLKAHTRVPNILHGLGVQGLHAYTDSKAGIMSRALNMFVEAFSDATTSFDEHCDNHVCHRITFMYGLMWEHENLNPQTHASLHEVFGYGTATFFKHLSACMRKQHLVDENGNSALYLPDFDSRRRLESKAYMAHMKRLDVPIMFYSGKENKAFPPAATLRAYERCKEAFPEQDYQRLVFEGYGHLDHMMGKKSEEDIFKKLLPFLDRYSQSAASQDTPGTPV
ncbi:uncharacterized protein [Amphiura filiformis]|uniref:uncharacterized protein n=1 Tax=Amphiura filiformis TaxID=82378 RepID=UPI003B21145B